MGGAPSQWSSGIAAWFSPRLLPFSRTGAAFVSRGVIIYETYAIGRIMIRDEKTEVSNLPPTALYPATALLAAAASGSVVATYASLSIRAIQPVVLLSFTLLGVGFLLALAILANYTSRLLTNSSPPPKKAMSSFVPVASISNAGYAVTALVRDWRSVIQIRRD